MKVFLTGGTGFIGSYVVMELLKNGHEITIFARNQNKVPSLNSLDGKYHADSKKQKTRSPIFHL